MARAETVTLLSLDRFFTHIGVDPLSANGLTSSLLTPLACSSVLYQYAWQSPAQAGREEYANALSQAESDIAAYVGYWPAPTYTKDEQRMTVRPQDPTLVTAGVSPWSYGGFGYGAGNARWFPKSVNLRYGKFISGGVKAKTLIEAGATVTYSDEDGDTFPETATVVVTTAVDELCEIHLFDPGKSGADSWEIRPITVTAGPGAGEVTITCQRAQCVLPGLWDAFNAGTTVLDADDDDNFLEEVDVYRVYLDPSVQVNLITESAGCLYCTGAGCQACGFAVATGCITGRDKRLGVVTFRPATWNAETLQFDADGYCWREADRLELSYLSGELNEDAACPRNTLTPFWERTIALLAMSYVVGMPCDCTAVKTFYNYCQTDLALSDGNTNQSYNSGDRVIRCPWGSRRGSVEAFARCNQPGHVIPR